MACCKEEVGHQCRLRNCNQSCEFCVCASKTYSQSYGGKNPNIYFFAFFLKIRALGYIHSKGLVFCDIKPPNLAVGRHKNTSEVFFLSFAFGESYANAFDSDMQRLKAKYIRGTPEYMSVEALNKFTLVQKDDLISLGIVLMELNGARIPWINKANDEHDVFERIDIILRVRQKYSIKVI